MTPEQEKLAARIAELKAFAGKYFANKLTGLIVKVEDYAGIKVKDGVSAHTFQVEAQQSRWTPAATQFLAEHDEVPAPAQPVTSTEII